MNPSHRVLQEAADWFAVMTSDQHSDADRHAWQSWLSDPEHACAWQKVERISAQMCQLSSASAPAARMALAQPRMGRRQALATLSVLIGAGTIAWAAGGNTVFQRWQADAATSVGETRKLSLADSTVWPNSDSAIDVFGKRVDLLRGEILIHVSHSAPAQITCAFGQVALSSGTHCSLALRDHDGACLSVFKGQADLIVAGRSDRRIVASDQSAHFNSSRARLHPRSQQARQAWASGTLLADDRPLGEVLDDLARYRHGYLGYDPAVASLRVVGAFPLAHSDRILDALEGTLPVRIRRTLPWWVTVEPA
jgi:transmembrane sensor